MMRRVHSEEFFRVGPEHKTLSLEDLESFSDQYITPNVERNQIDEDEFANVYDSSVIEFDKKKVEGRKLDFARALQASEMTDEERETQKKLDILAREFEAICSDHTILSRGFGMKRGEIRAQSTSDFDDIMRKIDLVLEFPQQKNPEAKPGNFAVGVDVTISKSGHRKKFRDLYERFKTQSLTEIKYYREANDGLDGTRLPIMGAVKIPRYIINAKPEELMEMIEGWKMWRDNFNSATTSTEKNELLKKTNLTSNKIWYRILYQMEKQADTFYRYFKEKDPAASEIYRQNYMMFLKMRFNMVMKLISQNEDWHMKMTTIQSEKNEKDRQARFDYLRNDVHQTVKGDDMGKLMAVIRNQVY